jgi:hypothetical protein
LAAGSKFDTILGIPLCLLSISQRKSRTLKQDEKTETKNIKAFSVAPETGAASFAPNKEAYNKRKKEKKEWTTLGFFAENEENGWCLGSNGFGALFNIFSVYRPFWGDLYLGAG